MKFIQLRLSTYISHKALPVQHLAQWCFRPFCCFPNEKYLLFIDQNPLLKGL